jgi:hypothetical protein
VNPPESFTRQAVLLDREASPRRLEDARELAALLRPTWQEMSHEIEGPIASRQYFCETLIDPPIASQTQVAAAADTVLWDAANLTPLAANQVRAGQAYKVTAWGVMTTPSTASQTAIWTPRFGTTTGGTSLGSSATWPVGPAVLTAIPWFAQMFVLCRTTGSSGTMVCGGLVSCQAYTGVAAATTWGHGVPIGGAGATINTTVASGLVLSVTPSHSTQTYTCQGVVMEALN